MIGSYRVGCELDISQTGHIDHRLSRLSDVQLTLYKAVTGDTLFYVESRVSYHHHLPCRMRVGHPT